MSDTPETDAAAFDAFDGQGGEVVFAAFAGQLERERNSLQDQRDLALRMAKEREKERDEARRKVAELQAGLDDIEEYGTEEINAAVDLRHQLAAALCELSALRKEVNISAADVAVLKRRCDALKAERDAANEELEWLRKDSEQGEPQPLRAGEPSDFEGAIRRMRDAERERDDLNSQKEANHQCLLILERDLYKTREERDKAISVADRLIEYAHECLVKLASWGQGYQRYEEEMDTIREDIAAYDMMKEALK